MERVIFLGPPGCGKTYTLLQHLQSVLQQGVPPERIAFLTFTRRARSEAVTRVEATLGRTAKELPFFRTIHSMAYRALKLQEGDVMGRTELAEFGSTHGLIFGASSADDQVSEGITSANVGDYLMAVDSLSRLRGATPRSVWEQTSAADTPCDWPTTEHFVNSYRAYKQEKGLMDFTDVLEQFIKADIDLPVDVAFIDEAQDLSALQWYVALKSCQQAKQQFIAGDDDQAIFQWAGADVEFFQKLDGRRQVLTTSHRLPRAVHTLAQGILGRIKQRILKEFSPRDAQGAVQRHATVQGLEVKPGERWLWLVRNRYQISSLKERLEQLGIVYASQHGQGSIVDSERDAVYTWERLRSGRAVSVIDARDLYSKLRTKEQVKHGYKALPGVDDHEELNLQELTSKHGLLVSSSLPWYDVLHTIPVTRRGYYRKLLRTHQTLKLPTQVVIETIHGAKGGEASQVALFLDMSRRVMLEANKAPDPEHRVWYVGATRARDTLHVVAASGRFAYPLKVA